MKTVVTARRLVSAGVETANPVLLIEDGYITDIDARNALSIPADARIMDFPGATLVSAFLDIHIHGCAGHDIMEATPSALTVIGKFLVAHGVGAYLPTTVTASVEETLRCLDGLASIIDSPEKLVGAQPLGMHLEGPFLSVAKRGVHPPDKLLAPSIETFEQFWQASRGLIRLLTIAPELDGAIELITYATHLGVRCSLGHSNADTAQAVAGVAAGASSATHTFNAMRSLDHRDPGIAGVVLDRDDLFAEIICDGHHVDPSMVRLFFKAKGRRRAILITDGMSATGMPDGTYLLGGLRVEVANGRCMYEGVLAGSVLTLDRAVRNFMEFTHTDLATTSQLATTNPATLMGVEETYGVLAPGRRADIAVLTTSGNVQATLLAGIPANT
jgi:N-acetylglucosamine-6-phosphate deacetylase